MKQLTEAQIYLTRQCNLRCGYCKLTNDTLDELDLDDWKIVYDNLERIGIKTVKLMGGEPTLKSWLPELLTYSTKKQIKTAVLSNSLFSDTTLDALVNAGLWGYFASVDTINDLKAVDGDASRKSHNGYTMLRKLKKRGVPLLAANVVISKVNALEIPNIVQTLSEQGIYSNVCSIQHTTNEEKCFCQPTINDAFRFHDDDRDMLDILARKLITLKRQGVKIAIPESYLRGLPQYAISCNWQCREPLQLRIDADGGMMLCNEFRTILAETYNAVTLPPAMYSRFLQEWITVRNDLTCDGCYWSCFLQAEENLKQGRLEFDYMLVSSNNHILSESDHLLCS